MANRAAEAGDNFLSPEKVTNFVERIENLKGDMDSAKGEYMNECKARREDIECVYDEAKDAGMPKKALKAVIKARDLERKAKAAREDLFDLDLQDKFDLIRHKLGDLAETPLGQAAMEAADNGTAAAA